jgi:hypothetical protein
MDVVDPATWASIKQAIGTIRDAVGLARDVKQFLPPSKQEENIAHSLDTADRAIDLAEVQIAKGLGYNLCQCAFPPKIMLKNGMCEQTGREIFSCQACGSEYPNRLQEQRRKERQEATTLANRAQRDRWMAR